MFFKKAKLIDLADKEVLMLPNFKHTKLKNWHQRIAQLIGTQKKKTLSQYKLFKKFDKFDFSHYKTLYLYCRKKKLSLHQHLLTKKL